MERTSEQRVLGYLSTERFSNRTFGAIYRVVKDTGITRGELAALLTDLIARGLVKRFGTGILFEGREDYNYNKTPVGYWTGP